MASALAILLLSLSISPAASAADPVPNPSMDLTGTPSLGNALTVSFKDGVTPVGEFFDIWGCPNKDVLPDAINVPSNGVGDCEKITYWPRWLVDGFLDSPDTTALSMKWILQDTATPGLNPDDNDAPYLNRFGATLNVDPPPINASTGEADWCAFEGWYIIVHDYKNSGTRGGHSNWSEPFTTAECGGGNLPDEESEGEEETEDEDKAALPQTGAPLGLWVAVAGLAAAGAGAVALRRRVS